MSGFCEHCIRILDKERTFTDLKGRGFCSTGCRDFFNSTAVMLGEEGPEEKCRHCYCIISSDDVWTAKDGRKFCSQACRSVYEQEEEKAAEQEEEKPKPSKTEDTCANCGGTFGETYRRSASKSFCSVECSAKFKAVEEAFSPKKPKQVGGTHYQDMAICPAEYATKNALGFLEGNVVKYVSRHHKKNGAEDLRKAIQCIQLLLEYEYNDKEV